MQSDLRRPQEEDRFGAPSPAIPLEVMVLDVPREFIPDVEQGIVGLADAYGIELVDAAGVAAEPAYPGLAGIQASLELPDTAGNETRRTLLRVAASPDLGHAPRSADELERAPFLGGALFGAEDQAVTVGDEVLDLARRLPDSRAAVVVMFRNGWRTELDSLLRSNGAEVLLERSLEGSGDDGGRLIDGLPQG